PPFAAPWTATADGGTQRRNRGKGGRKALRSLYRQLGSAGHAGAAAALAPPVDADKQEQPDDVDEVPIPRGRLEPEVVVGLEISAPGPKQADDQDRRADDDVEAMKAGRHEEGRGIDAAAKAERSVAVFVGLHRGEADTEKDGQRQAAQQSAAVTLDQ